MSLDILSLVVLFLILIINPINSSSSPLFTTKGNKIYKNGNWITFNGIGLTCTEYMMKPGIDDLNSYPGNWSYSECFGGPTSLNGSIELNNEPYNILKLLTKSNFNLNPKITKISMNSQYNQVIDLLNYPQHHPIIRIPTTGSTYLYDQDCVTKNHLDYVNTLDKIINFFTSNEIAISFDMHWNCPDQTTIKNCPNAQTAPMALKNFGSLNGSIKFWDHVSLKYSNNSYVFYELFNEPYLKSGISNYNIYYNGNNNGSNSIYAGMKEMYNTIRKNAPNSLIIISGMQDYAFDSTSLISFWLQYKNETKNYPINLLFNYHPYQGSGQGNEKSPQATLREILAGKTIAPIIITEFGQYCCSEYNNKNQCTGGGAQCNAQNSGPNFVFNIVNLCLEYDLSWIGWAWRGTNSDTCINNEPNCDSPDMRGPGYPNATLVKGNYGGANWTEIWETFIIPDEINVKDTLGNDGSFLTPNDFEPKGYLPRSCIMGDYNMANNCGWDLNVSIDQLSVSDFNDGNLFYAWLPGMPPKGNCSLQGCPGYPCNVHPICVPY